MIVDKTRTVKSAWSSPQECEVRVGAFGVTRITAESDVTLTAWVGKHPSVSLSTLDLFAIQYVLPPPEPTPPEPPTMRMNPEQWVALRDLLRRAERLEEQHTEGICHSDCVVAARKAIKELEAQVE